MIKFSLVFLFLFSSFSQMKFLTDSSETINYLNIKGKFLSEYKKKIKKNSFRLETIVIRDIIFLKKRDKKILFDLIKDNSNSLKKIIISNCKFYSTDFVNLISNFNKKSKLTTLIWEDCKDLDDEIEHIISKKIFWKNIQTLSFRETDLGDDEEFFLDKVKCEKLISLDLSDTDITHIELKRFIDHSKNFPKLNSLKLDDIKILRLESTNEFKELEFISLLDITVNKKEMEFFLSKNKRLMKNIKHIRFNNVFDFPDEDNYKNKSKRTYLIKNRVLTLNDEGKIQPLKKLETDFFITFPKLKNLSVFHAPHSETDYSIDGLIISNDEEANILKLNKNKYLYPYLSFIGPNVSLFKIEELINELKLKHIFLIDLIVDKEELISLKKNYKHIRFNEFTNFSFKGSNYNFNWTQNLSQQQFHQNMMINTLKNIPKF